MKNKIKINTLSNYFLNNDGNFNKEDALIKSNNPLKDDIKNYTRGARCTFKDFYCTSNCEFKEGKNLTRKI